MRSGYYLNALLDDRIEHILPIRTILRRITFRTRPCIARCIVVAAPVKAPLDTSDDVSSAVICGLQEDDFVSIVYNGFCVSLLGIDWVRKNNGVEWAISKGTKLTGGEGWQVGERRLRDGVLRHV